MRRLRTKMVFWRTLLFLRRLRSTLVVPSRLCGRFAGFTLFLRVLRCLLLAPTALLIMPMCLTAQAAQVVLGAFVTL